MKVFISWSGERGKKIGEAFRGWLPDVLQSVQPFYSPDIEKGQRWSAEIEQNLKECQVGIICVTPESMTSPWLMFESGAISNAKLNRVCPLLFQVESTQLTGPLSQFQATPYSVEEVRKLIQSINGFSTAPLTDAQTERTFERWWPELDKLISAALKDPILSNKPSRRSLEDLVQETLSTVRTLANTSRDEDSINHWIVLFRAMLDLGIAMERIAESNIDFQDKSVQMLQTTIHHLRLTLNLAQPKIAKAGSYKELQVEAKSLMAKLESSLEMLEIPF